MAAFRNCDWYTCPNGHLYVIGECRLPMAMGKCPTCGERLGGKSHRMIENNRRLGRVERQGLMNKGISIDQFSIDLLGEPEQEKFLKYTPIMQTSEIDKFDNPYENRRTRKNRLKQERQAQSTRPSRQPKPDPNSGSDEDMFSIFDSCVAE
jgi:hypothetical protein